MKSRMAGWARTWWLAALSLLMTSGGVPAGATSPVEPLASKPLTPASSKVGVSGSCGERLARLVAASARTLPLRP